MSAFHRVGTTALGICAELKSAWTHCQRRSFLRYGADVFAYRYMRFRRPRKYDEIRCIAFKDGVRLAYRLNRADIQTVREVWFNETYRLPFELPGSGGTLVDLGGNIGHATVYLTRRYGFTRVAIIEPVAENAALARINCELNGIDAEIVQAAIAPRAGEVNFALDNLHNQGRVDTTSTDGIRVKATTVPDVVGASGTIRLVKMDIEGGEGQLLREEAGWLTRVVALVAEFHPTIVDCAQLVDVVKRHGFAFFPVGSVHPLSTDAFLRDVRLEEAG